MFRLGFLRHTGEYRQEGHPFRRYGLVPATSVMYPSRSLNPALFPTCTTHRCCSLGLLQPCEGFPTIAEAKSLPVRLPHQPWRPGNDASPNRVHRFYSSSSPGGEQLQGSCKSVRITPPVLLSLLKKKSNRNTWSAPPPKCSSAASGPGMASV